MMKIRGKQKRCALCGYQILSYFVDRHQKTFEIVPEDGHRTFPDVREASLPAVSACAFFFCACAFFFCACAFFFCACAFFFCAGAFFLSASSDGLIKRRMLWFVLPGIVQ
jgi:hypothetical protein